MKVFYEPQFLGQVAQEELDIVVAKTMDGSTHDRGQLEAAQATADSCANALGRLLNMLAERGQLSLADVAFVIDRRLASTAEEITSLYKRKRS